VSINCIAGLHVAIGGRIDYRKAAAAHVVRIEGNRGTAGGKGGSES